MKKSFTPLEILKAMFYTRVSQSKNYSRWHTGHTKDLRKRFNEHNLGIIFPPINNSKRFLSLTGFTLVELVTVVAIIGILISLAVPQFTTAAEKARAAEGVAILNAVRAAQLRLHAETGSYAPAFCQVTAGNNCGLDINVGTLKYFGAPVCSVVDLAYVSNGKYLLSIKEDGTIKCLDGPPDCWCRKLGYGGVCGPSATVEPPVPTETAPPETMLPAEP